MGITTHPIAHLNSRPRCFRSPLPFYIQYIIKPFWLYFQNVFHQRLSHQRLSLELLQELYSWYSCFCFFSPSCCLWCFSSSLGIKLILQSLISSYIFWPLILSVTNHLPSFSSFPTLVSQAFVLLLECAKCLLFWTSLFPLCKISASYCYKLTCSTRLCSNIPSLVILTHLPLPHSHHHFITFLFYFFTDTQHYLKLQCSRISLLFSPTRMWAP